MRRLLIAFPIAPALGLADALQTLQLNADGGFDQVLMRAEDPETDFSFDFHDLLLKPKRAR